MDGGVYSYRKVAGRVGVGMKISASDKIWRNKDKTEEKKLWTEESLGSSRVVGLGWGGSQGNMKIFWEKYENILREIWKSFARNMNMWQNLGGVFS